MTPAYQKQLLQLVRRRPHSLDLPFATWTLQRLADELPERTGIRVREQKRCGSTSKPPTLFYVGLNIPSVAPIRSMR